MATRAPTREEALAKLNEERAVFSQLLRQAEASGDKEAYQRYSDRISKLDAQIRGTGTLGELGSGVASAAVGLLTGIPDIVISGYNQAARANVPTLRERLLSAAGIPTEATSEQGSLVYGAPEIATAAASIGQLATLGFQGTKAWLQGRKVNALLDKLPAEEANRFRDLMLRGQGSPNAEVAAQIAKLRSNPKFTEAFNALDEAATKAAMSGMAPRPSRMEEPTAARGAMQAVEDKLSAMRQARSEAGNTNFTKAFEQGGNRQILNTENLLGTVRQLKADYAGQNSDSARSAVRWLQSIEDDLVPKINVPGRAGTTVTSPLAARDPLTNAPIPGQEVTYNIPGSPGYTTTQAPRTLTVQETQAKLKDWGRSAAAEDQVVRDLAISDERRISSALFGSIQKDIEASKAAATSSADKKALGLLQSARAQTRQASEAYNEAVAQGIPKAFQNKNVNEISFEDLSSAYKNLNPSQRAQFRSWVGENKQEALKAIDSDVFQAFKAKHTGTLPDGTIGTDLKSMAEDWATMSAKDKDALAAALGQNVNEFNGRMKDALAFTRRLQTGSLGAEEAAQRQLVREGAAVVGASPAGYSGSKAFQLAGDILGGFRSGIISDELAFKTLLTPEGANFLKQASLTPGSQKTLEALTNLETVAPKLPQYLAPTGAITAPVTTVQPQAGQEPQITIPDFGESNMGQPTAQQQPEIVIPDFGEQ